MQTAIYLLITFFTAVIVAYVNLANSDKFRNFFFLIKATAPVLFYSACYGIIGILLYLLLKDNVISIPDTNINLPAGYMYAIAVGVATKGIAELNFFNIRSGATTIPVGIKTITQPLDRLFEQRIDAISFVRYCDYLKPYQVKYKAAVTNIDAFKKDCITQLNQYHPDKKKVAAFAASEDFSRASGTDELLALVLKEFGQTIFEKIFPK